MQEFTLPDLSPPSPALSARSDTSNQSTLSRIRNFSLVGTRQSKNYNLPAPATEGSTPNPGMNDKNTHLRQMTSLERLSSTLAALTQSSSSSVSDSHRSLSPASRSSLSLTYADSGSEDDYVDDGFDSGGGEWKEKRRSRTKSDASMLDEMRFGRDDDRDDEYDNDDLDIEVGYGYEGEGEGEGEGEDCPENEEEAAEEAFDEDFFATGEMKNVPFL